MMNMIHQSEITVSCPASKKRDHKVGSLLDYLNTECIKYLCGPGLWAYGIDAFSIENKPRIVLLPENNDEYEKVISFCFKNRLKVLVRGGGTSYTGASVATGNEIVVSTRKINQMDMPAERGNMAWAAPGITPYEFNEYLLEKQLRFIPDPASFKVCTVGGNVATNAGGPRCFRYGVTSNYVKKIKCYFRNKWRTFGSDSHYSRNFSFNDIIVGSEGTLLPFSKVLFKLRKMPPRQKNYLIRFSSYCKALSFIDAVLEKGIIPATIDMSTVPFIPGVQTSRAASLFIVLEGAGRVVEEESEAIENLCHLFNAGFIHDEIENNLMKLRADHVKERVSKTISLSGKKQYFLFDACVPRDRLNNILDFIYELAGKLNFPLMNTFHVGDGNIHPTIFYNPGPDDENLKVFWYMVMKKVYRLGGVITGEHGLGIEKTPVFLSLSTPGIKKIHKIIKNFFDPEALMAPGKILQTSCETEKIIRDLDRLTQTHLPEYSTIDSAGETLAFPGLSSGIVAVNPDRSLAEINGELEKSGYYLPYRPIAFANEKLSFYLEHNIPNSTGYLFELKDLLVGGEIICSKTNKKMEIGRPVLKNVSGYNLNFLLFENIIGKAARCYLKIFPVAKKTAKYAFLEANTNRAGVESFLAKSEHMVESYFISNTGKGVKLTLIMHNDEDLIRSLINSSDQTTWSQITESELPFMKDGFHLVTARFAMPTVLQYLETSVGGIYSSHEQFILIPDVPGFNRLNNTDFELLEKERVESVHHFTADGHHKVVFQNRQLSSESRYKAKFFNDLKKRIYG